MQKYLSLSLRVMYMLKINRVFTYFLFSILYQSISFSLIGSSLDFLSLNVGGKYSGKYKSCYIFSNDNLVPFYYYSSEQANISGKLFETGQSSYLDRAKIIKNTNFEITLNEFPYEGDAELMNAFGRLLEVVPDKGNLPEACEMKSKIDSWKFYLDSFTVGLYIKYFKEWRLGVHVKLFALDCVAEDISILFTEFNGVDILAKFPQVSLEENVSNIIKGDNIEIPGVRGYVISGIKNRSAGVGFNAFFLNKYKDIFYSSLIKVTIFPISNIYLLFYDCSTSGDDNATILTSINREGVFIEDAPNLAGDAIVTVYVNNDSRNSIKSNILIRDKVAKLLSDISIQGTVFGNIVYNVFDSLYVGICLGIECRYQTCDIKSDFNIFRNLSILAGFSAILEL